MAKYEPKLPLSVVLIAKNEAANVKRVAANLKEVLNHRDDEVILVDTGSTDATKRIAKNCKWRLVDGADLCSMDYRKLASKWLPEALVTQYEQHQHFTGGVLRSFSEARQRGQNAAKNRLIFWMDLDDELVGGKDFREGIDTVFAGGGPGSLLMLYEYAHDPTDGACIMTLWRERVFTKDDYHWAGRCHETCLPNQGSFDQHTVARDPNWPCKIIHRAPKKHGFSDLRNFIILRNELDECGSTGKKPDPRTTYYLANACRGLHLHEQANLLYDEFCQTTGSREDHLSSRLNQMMMLYDEGRYYRALDYGLMAQKINPHDPRVYYYQAELWMKLECWPNALRMVELGDACQVQDTLHAVDPLALTFHPAAIGAMACRELRMPDRCLAYAERAVRERPNLPACQQALHDTQQWVQVMRYAEGVAHVLAGSKNPVTVAQNIRIPPYLCEFGMGSPETAVPGAETGKPTIAFFCGHSSEKWGPPTDEVGLGASEKMVVEMAERLASRGFAVTVYCSLNCPEGRYAGVEWRWTAHYNYELYRDFLVLWRLPQTLETLPFRAGRIYVWMHDVGHNGAWTPTVQARVDKVIFLSKFQRSLHPSLPEDKVYYSRNGVDLERHIYDRRPKQQRIVYCSSPDRGWLTAINVFNQSELAEDGYKLHLFYGFGKTWRTMMAQHPYGYVVELGRDMDRLLYEDWCLRACDQRTVINRGRVGWRQMAEELQDADIWLYPTKFDEISCVAAMEAAAAGCKCVSTDHAALAETLAGCPGRTILTNDNAADWGQQLRAAAETTIDRYAEGQFAVRFDMDALAAQWVADLLVKPATVVTDEEIVL